MTMIVVVVVHISRLRTVLLLLVNLSLFQDQNLYRKIVLVVSIKKKIVVVFKEICNPVVIEYKVV